MKKGRFSKQEISLIKNNYKKLSYEQLGEKLDRDPESVEKFIKEKLGKNVSSTEERAIQAEYDLKQRLYWKDLKEQFSKDE